MNMHVTRHTMQIMDPTGHTTVAWEQGDTAEVEVARTTFDEMTRKGYQAFRVGKNGERGTRMTAFDPAAEEMLLIPQLVGG
jgi:hypothetical protein